MAWLAFVDKHAPVSHQRSTYIAARLARAYTQFNENLRMNQYPIWKYVVMVAALLFGLLYTLPNFFGEAPAVQVSSGRTTVQVDVGMLDRVQEILAKDNIEPGKIFFDGNSVRARLVDTDTQLKARDILSRELNPDPEAPDYIVALNLLTNSPDWLTNINALPMYLGLDLRGGVHFLLQVDMEEALLKRIETSGSDARTALREARIRHRGVDRQGNQLELRFLDEATRERASEVVRSAVADMQFREGLSGDRPALIGTFTEEAEDLIRQNALSQNITTLTNRVNEIGVAEPVIQRQGEDRIIVQLPGVKEPAKAKAIMGRTATL